MNLTSILFGLFLWFTVILVNFFKHGRFKYKKFKFSLNNYYLLMSPFVAAVLFYAASVKSFKPIAAFMIFAIAGVVGETITDIWWQSFFGQRLWVYNVKTLYHRYTSWLNFIPWAVGGTLYTVIANIVVDYDYPGFELFFLVFMSALVVMQLFLFRLFKPTANFKFHNISMLSVVVFYCPIIFIIVFMAWLYGSQIYELALWFALIPTIAEYLFGKATQFFISKKLWDYTYLSVDRGHFTPLSVPLFCLGGFYFWVIIRLFGL